MSEFQLSASTVQRASRVRLAIAKTILLPAFSVIVLCIAATIAAFAAEPAQTADVTWTPPQAQSALSSAVIDGNLFRANRTLPASPRDAESPEEISTPPAATEEQQDETPAPVSDPDHRYVLTGVVVIDGVAVAFVEDRADGELKRIDKPGPFAQGRIVSIAWDAVTYEVGGDTRKILLRHTFAGLPAGAATSMQSATGASTSTNAAGSSSAAPSPAAMSILERLRQRRLQEAASSTGSE